MLLRGDILPETDGVLSPSTVHLSPKVTTSRIATTCSRLLHRGFHDLARIELDVIPYDIPYNDTPLDYDTNLLCPHML